MKKILIPVILLGTAVVAALLNSPEATSAAVQVPEALKTILSGLILAGVVTGLQVVFDWIGLDLRGVGAAIAAALSGFAIAQLQGYIDAIPVQYDQAVTIILTVLVVVLSGLGALRLLIQRERVLPLLR